MGKSANIRKRQRLTAALAGCVVVAAIAIWVYVKPYRLPEITSDIAVELFRVDFSAEREAAETAVFEVSELQALVENEPDNLVYSTLLRQALQPAEFREFAKSFGQSDRMMLQVALSYADELQNLDLGTASLGQRSSESIRELNRILEHSPYDLLAHYARGLNNLYWPTGLQRMDKSLQDLEFCLAAVRYLEKKGIRNALWPEIYAAYGDALVKNGKTAEGMSVWRQGNSQYPDYERMFARAKADEREAIAIVKAERGIESFHRPEPERTDLSILWQ